MNDQHAGAPVRARSARPVRLADRVSAWPRRLATVALWFVLAAGCQVAPVAPTSMPVPSAPSASPLAITASPSINPTGTGAPSAAPTLPSAEPPTAVSATPSAPAATPVPAVTASTTAAATLGSTSRGRAENFTLIGHDPLSGRGWNAGLALNYPCAYVGNRRLPQVAIVDVSDPAAPQSAGVLSLAPGVQPVEVRAVPDLGLLVVLNFSSQLSVLTFDAHDCRQPRPLGRLGLGEVPHEFYLWRDPAQPSRVLLYVAAFQHEQPDLQVVDLSDPAAPRVVGQWTAAADHAAGTLHSISLSADGKRAYLSMWEGGFLLADVSDFAAGRPQSSLRLLNAGAAILPPPGVDVHSAVPVGDGNTVLLTQEVYTCPYGGLSLADIHDPAQPRLIGDFRLPENDPACADLPEADAVFTAHNPLVVGGLVFVTWYGGGLQALDISQPAHPARVGVFVPDGTGPAGGSPYGRYPVQLWSYPILRAGLIYVSDIKSGLYIVRYSGPRAAQVNAVALAQGNASE